MRTRTGWRLRGPVLVLSAGIALLAGCSGGPASASPELPPDGAAFDYQLGGAYPPPDGVEIVVRDRTAGPLEDAYSICYVNGFQTQPGEQDLWPAGTDRKSTRLHSST